MRKAIGAAVLGLVSMLAFGVAAQEPPPIPKEGSGTQISAGSATLKALQLGTDRMQLTWEFLGANTDESGKGINHNSSVRCIGSAYVVNGVYETYTNSCVFTRTDGDQIFTTEKLTEMTGPMAKGGLVKGTSVITGGTGKLAGITGSIEWMRYAVRPALEGTVQTVTRAKSSYKLP